MQRMTKQKKLLHEEVSKQNSFFTAHELHTKIQTINAKIGLATIYRFLNTLEKNGNIHSFICNNKKVYSNNTRNHTHFTCERCGNVQHITIKNIDFLKKSVEEDICHFQIELTGICKRCKQLK